MDLIIQIIAGLVGGNAAGAGLKNLSLGTAGNSVAGAVGGGLGGLPCGIRLGGRDECRPELPGRRSTVRSALGPNYSGRP